MDNKRVQIIIVISLLICLITILAVGSSVKKDNFMPEKTAPSSTRYSEINDSSKKIEDIEEIKEIKYYINVIGEGIPNVSYQFEMDDEGAVSLRTESLSSEFDLEKTINNYDFLLDEVEISKVVNILNCLSNRNSLNDKEDYYIYYDEETNNISSEEKNYFLEALGAIESIALNDEIIEGRTRRELGNELLDNLIIKLNIQEERPTN